MVHKINGNTFVIMGSVVLPGNCISTGGNFLLRFYACQDGKVVGVTAGSHVPSQLTTVWYYVMGGWKSVTIATEGELRTRLSNFMTRVNVVLCSPGFWVLRTRPKVKLLLFLSQLITLAICAVVIVCNDYRIMEERDNVDINFNVLLTLMNAAIPRSGALL